MSKTLIVILMPALLILLASCGPADQGANVGRALNAEDKSDIIAGHEITAEEYAVYSDLIEVMYFRTLPFPEDNGLLWFSYSDHRSIQPAIEILIVKDHTHCEEQFYQFLEKVSNISGDIIKDHKTKNSRKYRLKNLFEFPRNPHLSDKIVFESQKELSNGKKSQGILTFSRVGFNTDRTKALVLVANQVSGLEGAGLFILLSEEESRWAIQEEYLMWVS